MLVQAVLENSAYLLVVRKHAVGNMNVSRVKDGDQVKYSRIPTEVLVVECN